MKKQLMIVGIILILLTVGFSGCNENNNTVQSDEEKIIGKWTYSTEYNNYSVSLSYVFSSNNTFEVFSSLNDEVHASNGTWSLADNKLLITAKSQDTLTNDYKFSNNNTELILTDSSGNIAVFKKQI